MAKIFIFLPLPEYVNFFVILGVLIVVVWFIIKRKKNKAGQSKDKLASFSSASGGLKF
jgi:preprotein translocase subunit YajC